MRLGQRNDQRLGLLLAAGALMAPAPAAAATTATGLRAFAPQVTLSAAPLTAARNPPTCQAQPVTAAFSSQGGQTAASSAPSAPTGCEGLAFTPKLTATLGSADWPARVGGHPPLTTVVTQPDHQAVIRKAVVTLPPGLFANLAALQTLCTVGQANTNACPAGSLVGSAKAVSPLLPTTPLTGSVFIAENPSGGLPRLVMRLANELLTVPVVATTTLKGSRLETTLDNLPAAPVTSFELNINGGPTGLFTVGNALCDNAVIDSSFTSHTGQSTTERSPVNIVGTCVPVPPPGGAASTSPALPPKQGGTTARPSLSMSVRGLAGTPQLILRARSAHGAAKLRSVRLSLPSSKLAFVRAALDRGVVIRAGSNRLTGARWSLSRSGALTVQAPRGGSPVILATIQSGALRSGKALQKLARDRKALPRLTVLVRVTDAGNARYAYRLKVRPLR